PPCRSRLRLNRGDGRDWALPRRVSRQLGSLGGGGAPRRAHELIAKPCCGVGLPVDCSARLAEQRGGLSVGITAVVPGKLDNIGGETPLVVTTARDLALRRAMLPERRTGATLGDMQLRSHLLNAGTATREA